jgi:ankyrin repeat protein
VLNFLALAARPVLLAEVADFIAMDLENRRIDVDAQFQDPQDILTICSSLVTSTESSWHSVAEINKYACGDAVRQDLFARIHSRSLSRNYPGEELKLAHLSVKEWISSSAYTEIVTTRVGVSPKGPDLVAQTCLAYLLQFNTLRNFTKTSIAEYPFLNYAVYHWLHHVETCLTENSSLTTKQMACDLTKLNQVQFLNVAFVFNEACYHQPDRPWRSRGQSLVARWRDYVRAAKISGEKWDFASPLYWAAQFGKRKVCELLIAGGADPNASGGPRDTPLDAAIAEGHDSVVQLLITSGADIEPRGGHQYSPLQHACMKLNLEVVKILINNGADLNLTGGRGKTPLQIAFEADGSDDVIALLLQCGANENGLLRHCNTALQEAAFTGRDTIVALLLDRGANVNQIAGQYSTALCAAAYCGHVKVVRLLLSNGADVDIKNDHGWTATAFAFVQGHDHVLKELAESNLNPRSPLSNRGFPPDSVLAADSSSNITISLDGLTVSAGKSHTCITVDSQI